jgi:hypothetical protein
LLGGGADFRKDFFLRIEKKEMPYSWCNESKKKKEKEEQERITQMIIIQNGKKQ